MNSEPWARLMMPMTPNMRVSPLAIRNNSRPYWTPLRSCARNPGKSMAQRTRAPAKGTGPSHRRAGSRSASSQLAARSRIRQVLDGNADHLVQPALGFAQIDVLRHVLRRRHADGAARAVDLGSAQRLVEVGFVLGV